jgi:subtilisin family serine protease
MRSGASAGEPLEAARDAESAARDDRVGQHAVAEESEELSHLPIIGAAGSVHPSLAEWFSRSLHEPFTDTGRGRDTLSAPVRRLALLSVALLLGAAGAASGSPAAPQAEGEVELVVGLGQPPLAQAFLRGRSPAASHRRLNLRAPAAVAYVRELAAAQRTLAARIAAAIPQARIRWRYQVTANGLAVVVPRSEAARLSSVAGVACVYPSVTYHELLDRSPQLIGAPALWGSTLATAGNGIKIGIIDEGVDQTHPFFDPAGYTAPAGFPKGDTRYTTAKVIVARAFPPATPKWKNAALPFDPVNSEHGTHVAGIAAGNHGVYTGRALSGVAPNAYIGNYKALTIPTPEFGLDGNSPEIAAAIEAAVKDGMDVINLSLGEPEVNPADDLVVQAIDGAAAAGVVPVVAAGNDFEDFGRGSVGSPGSAQGAITVAAVSNGRGFPPDGIADFSSSGPTPITLQLKPDVSAPGINVISSLPPREGTWGTLSGTSMASPMVAGAAALLREQHPTWTVAQIKSALTLTGDPVHALGQVSGEIATTREGGGLVDLPRANAPLVFAAPSALSFGLVRVGATGNQTVSLADAGGGAGDWSVSAQVQPGSAAAAVTVPPTVSVPGTLAVNASPSAEGDVTGFVVLTHGADVRRIPFWLRGEQPRLVAEKATALAKTGIYGGTTAGKQSLVSSYRYPQPADAPALTGPEDVFRVHLARPAANFGVAVLTGDVTPRVVVGADENHLAGYPALPLDLNPYRTTYGNATPIVGAVLPAAGDYTVVFETTPGENPGRFSFRFWTNDTTAPAIVVPRRTPGRTVAIRVSDGGSGVDPGSIKLLVDGKSTRPPALRAAALHLRLAPGRHTLQVSASDRQEAKNMEDVGPILPNTRTVTASVRVG